MRVSHSRCCANTASGKTRSKICLALESAASQQIYANAFAALSGCLMFARAYVGLPSFRQITKELLVFSRGEGQSRSTSCKSPPSSPPEHSMRPDNFRRNRTRSRSQVSPRASNHAERVKCRSHCQVSCSSDITTVQEPLTGSPHTQSCYIHPAFAKV
jgi:hypothetical protein